MTIVKTYIIFLFLTLFFIPVYAQKKITYGFSVEPGYGLVNAQTPDCTNAKIKGSIYAKASVVSSYYLSKRIAIQSGISFFKTDLTFSADEYRTQVNASDSELKQYQRIISGIGISENSSLLGIIIPVNYVHEFPVNRNMRFFAAIGPSVIVPVKTESTVKGTFTYKGYYADGNFTLENIPIYGFDSNVLVNRKQKVNSGIALGGSVVVGLNSNINRYWRFFAQAGYSKNFTGYARNASDDYYLSNELGSFYSILENKAFLSNVTLGIGIQKIIFF